MHRYAVQPQLLVPSSEPVIAGCRHPFTRKGRNHRHDGVPATTRKLQETST